MAEWSKALRSGRSRVLPAWVRIPLLSLQFSHLGEGWVTDHIFIFLAVLYNYTQFSLIKIIITHNIIYTLFGQICYNKFCHLLRQIFHNKSVQKLIWQKWDSNPRRENPTATWTQRLRPLGHPAYRVRGLLFYSIYNINLFDPFMIFFCINRNNENYSYLIYSAGINPI